MSIQFHYGRTAYKRCHHAIEQAVHRLGKDWLFPSEVIECKPARIPFIEVEDSQDVEEKEDGPREGSSVSGTGIELNLFRKRPSERSSPRNRITPIAFCPADQSINRRITSWISFRSDTKEFSGETLTLTWFNKLLNPEQKDSVRRILRGQTRPLPYVRYVSLSYSMENHCVHISRNCVCRLSMDLLELGKQSQLLKQLCK